MALDARARKVTMANSAATKNALSAYQDQCKKNHAEIGEECGEGDTWGRVHDGVLRVPYVQ
jgi:hypothetical protein